MSGAGGGGGVRHVDRAGAACGMEAAKNAVRSTGQKEPQAAEVTGVAAGVVGRIGGSVAADLPRLRRRRRRRRVPSHLALAAVLVDWSPESVKGHSSPLCSRYATGRRRSGCVGRSSRRGQLEDHRRSPGSRWAPRSPGRGRLVAAGGAHDSGGSGREWSGLRCWPFSRSYRGCSQNQELMPGGFPGALLKKRPGKGRPPWRTPLTRKKSRELPYSAQPDNGPGHAQHLLSRAHGE